MAESKVIELKGITRNLTKIGVQDGQCDDLINLRLKDGSWRVSCDGKYVHTLPKDYEQLYVHTNVYHHLLGVLNGKLWYFADIDNDGETFTPLDTPVEICDVQGEVTIVQNGHLLTIISILSQSTPSASATSGEGDSINYSIFDARKNIYTYLNYDANGKNIDRVLYPFGNVYLNLDCDGKAFYKTRDRDEEAYVYVDENGININRSDAIVPREDESTTYAASQIWHSDMLYLFEQAKNENYFTQPFLAIVAAELYDGTYANLTNPILLSPREKFNFRKMCYDIDDKKSYTFANTLNFYPRAFIPRGDGGWNDDSFAHNSDTAPRRVGEYLPVYCSSAGSVRDIVGADGLATGFDMLSQVIGSNLIMSLGDTTDFFANSDIFKSICIFVTPQANIYHLDAEGYKQGEVVTYFEKDSHVACGNVCFSPKIRDYDDIIYDLMHSPFYLLRRYTQREITAKGLSNNSFVVDFQDPENSCPLKDLVASSKTLDNVVTYRGGYIPKVAYSYNQRLHIANYRSTLFHGYPIDYFQLSNHSVKLEQGNFAVGGVLPNLKDGTDFQYPRTKIHFLSNVEEDPIFQYLAAANQFGTCFAAISVTIETQQEESKVVRYIQPYKAHEFTNGDNANFVEYLGALLTYPDIRAKTMTVMVVTFHEGKVIRRVQAFPLKPHPYLNLAYYIDPELKPITLPVAAGSNNISLENFIIAGGGELFLPPQEANATESFPNGLKVSEVNNPLYFPYNTTYQIGSAEIVALMSNAVAVGTGQTGAAPLYVFCKDGVYALLVDSSGEMAYTNARIIARDVCNNAQSVTPIDSGVVFTTDRGLMSIAGNEVIELGQAAEGEVFDITDSSLTISNPDAADKAKKIMFNSFTYQQLGELPQELLDNVDFLTYLKGSIVNYNHNERELMVSNPEYPYTYIMDRYGNWSRRDYKADEYLNNYPTSYRVNEGSLYKVDAGDSVRGNCYMLSNVIKLGTVSFKQAMRLVVRGYFEVTQGTVLGCYIFGSYDGRQWSMLGGNEKQGSFTDIGCDIHHTDVKFLRLCIAGQLSGNSRLDFIELSYDNSQLNTKLR